MVSAVELAIPSILITLLITLISYILMKYTFVAESKVNHVQVVSQQREPAKVDGSAANDDKQVDPVVESNDSHGDTVQSSLNAMESSADNAVDSNARHMKESKRRRETALQQRLLQASNRNGSPQVTIDGLLNIISHVCLLSPDTVNDIHISTVFHRLAVAISNHSDKQRILSQLKLDQRMTEMINLAVERIPLSTPRVVTTIAWSVGKLDNHSPELLHVIADYVDRHLSALDSQGLANTIYAFALLQFKGTAGFLDRFSCHLPSRLVEMKPQEIANTTYALARLGVGDHHSDLFEAVAEFAAGHLHEFKTQECSNMVYAFSIVGTRHQGFLAAVERHILHRGIKSCVSQDVSNTLYGLAKLRFRCVGLCGAVCSTEGIGLLNSFNMQALSTTMSALAQLDHYSPEFVSAACATFSKHLANRQLSQRVSVTLQDVLYFTEALAKFKCLEIVPSEVMTQVSGFVVEKIWDMRPGEFIAVLQSMVTLKADCSSLLEASTDYVIAKIEDFRPASLTNLANSLAAAAHVNVRLLKAVSRRALQSADRFRPQNFIALGCSLSLLAWKDDAVFSRVEETFRVYSTTFCFDDLCRVAVCLIRSETPQALEEACALISTCPIEGSVDLELVVTLIRLFAKYKANNGHIRPHFAQAIEVFARLIASRVNTLVTADLMTACASVGKLAKSMSPEVVVGFYTAVVDRALPLKLAEMSVANVTMLLRGLSGCGASSEGERALFLLQSWLPQRLSSVTSDEVADLVSALAPFTALQTFHRE